MPARPAVVAVLVAALSAAMLGAGAWAVWRMAGDAKAGALLRPDDAALVRRGAGLYAAQCAACHGANLEGQPDWRSPGADGRLPAPPHDETGHTWHHDDATLFALTKHGLAAFAGAEYLSNMPAYAGVLSDEEIVAVLSFIKSRWPADIRAGHDALNEQARLRDQSRGAPTTP